MGGRKIIYCVIPRDLAPALHEPLRRFFRDDPLVGVIVERRTGDRRRGGERRRPNLATTPATGEARKVRNLDGLRIGERRLGLEPVKPPPLPRPARRHADRLVFVARVEPVGEEAEEATAKRLVTRLQLGDRSAFGEIYLRYFDRVYSYLRVILRDSAEAEDVAQEVFVRAFRALPDYELRGRPFRAWLFTIARNCAMSFLEAGSRIDTEAPAQIARRREGRGEELDLRALSWISDEELMLLIERLPVAQRQALVLRYLADLGATEIAAILGRTPESVRQLQHRALSFLRTRVGALGRGSERGESESMLRPVRRAWVLRARRFALMR